MTTLILFAATGLVLIAVSLPMIRRRVKPNRLYGLRVPATFADEWVWYEANARSGRDLFLAGVVQVVLAVTLRWLPGITESGYALANATAIGLGTIVVGIVGWRRANRLLDERRAGGA